MSITYQSINQSINQSIDATSIHGSVIVVGFAIDFSLHLVDSYLASDGMLDSAFDSNDTRQSMAVDLRASTAATTAATINAASSAFGRDSEGSSALHSVGGGGSGIAGGGGGGTSGARRTNRVDFDDGDAAFRYEKVREALSVTGVSIISGSMSTLVSE